MRRAPLVRAPAGVPSSPSLETNDWPSVTVVVPTRDRPDLLDRAIDGILGQWYPGSIECVVVFDQSPVRNLFPVGALASGAERSLRGVGNERTPGLAGARNSGIAAATGELVAFCDDDDEWLPDKLTRQVEALRSAPEADVVTCGILVNYEGHERERLAPASRMTLADFLRDRHTEVHPSTVMVRREALLGSIGTVDEDLPGSYAEDYEWLLRASRVAPIVAVQEPLVRIHWHRASYFEGRWRTIAAALTYLLDRYPEFEAEPKGLARIQGQIAFACAAAGEKADARRWARAALRRNRFERRAYLSLLVASKLVSADAVVRGAHLAGRGV